MNRRDVLKLGTAAFAGGVTLSLLGPVAIADTVVQVAAAQRFKIGDIVVTALSDGHIMLDPALFSGITPDEFQAALRAAYLAPGSYRGSVNAFVVDTGSKVFLIDSGTGAALGPALGRLERNLIAAGYQPSAISALLTTHLHPDHIGGSHREGKPVFDKAEFLVSQADHGFWSDAGIRAKAPAEAQMFFDLAVTAVKAYGDRLRLVSGEAEAVAGITAVPLPGHTPGHTGYRVTSGKDTLLIWGDIIHAGPVQFARPDVTLSFDVDQPLAAKTRKAVLEQVARDRVMIAGAHIPFPGVGHVEAAGAGYRFVPAEWDYL
ncbi:MULTISPECIES: MBL fold metallo-hydrolase [Rhodomicrobium]|uniref:MBL fold metallo-hydrolase n=1 Tax=Rhodomicrobium TaxID=1068 RepID=UPI000B4AB230|nr:MULTISPECIES: MBL fold metallo-hydrolase [Rhodomicrobium]